MQDLRKTIYFTFRAQGLELTRSLLSGRAKCLDGVREEDIEMPYNVHDG